MKEDLERLKQRLPLLEYLQQHQSSAAFRFKKLRP